MLDIMGKSPAAKPIKADVKELNRLALGIQGNARCDFCASAVTPSSMP